MERGAERFFADLRDWNRRTGRPAEHLTTVLSTAARTLERHPDSLRLPIGFSVQPPAPSAARSRSSSRPRAAQRVPVDGPHQRHPMVGIAVWVSGQYFLTRAAMALVSAGSGRR